MTIDIDLTKCPDLTLVCASPINLYLGSWGSEINQLKTKLTQIEQEKNNLTQQNQSLKTEKERLEKELAENKQVIREKLDESFIVIAPKS